MTIFHFRHVGYAVSYFRAKASYWPLINVIVSIAASFIGLPDTLKYHPELWNPTTHGNISFVVVLLLFRFVCRLFERSVASADSYLISESRGFWVLGGRDIISGRD
jgi:hypothetical protein